MDEEQPKPATVTSNSHFESAALSVVMPLASLVFGLAVGEIFRNGHAVFIAVILMLTFGFGLSIFSVVGSFRRRRAGTVILGSVGFVLNGGSLYYVSVMWLFVSNLRC